MNMITKRSMSVMLALVMILSLFAGISIPRAEAASYVANWGVRGQEATELSAKAVSFYKTAGVTYSGLSSLSGSSTLSSVPSSPLFTQLQSIMKTYHTHETDYEETKDLYKYTDCQEGKTQYITCIWCGEQYDGAWPYGGDPWNREHTWPKSKSLDGNDPDVDQVDEEDIMLLRPACRGENSSHSNKAYGSTTNDTYFYPNIDKGYGNDARGDIARTMLYVYVRYGNSAYMWGSAGVIQSKELLLQWMKEDPVDTWEMGRNDSVQSITGTRNVFIDYPELAFKLFNTAVPSGYQTPSGGVDSGSGATVTVKFMENGVLTSSKSATEGSAFTFPAASKTITGYSFVGWVASTVNETTVRPDTIYSAGGSALAGNRTYHALYSKVDNTQTGSDYVLHSGAVTQGDYMFIAGGGAMTSAANGSAKRLDVIPVTITNNTVYSPDSALIWHIATTTDGYYTFYNKAVNKYAAANGTSNQLVMSSTVNDYAKWSISSSGVITNKGNLAKGVNYTLRRNNNFGFSCYKYDTGTAPVLYKATTGALVYTTTIQGVACQHLTTYISGKVNATCTSAGYSGDTYCTSCGEKVDAGTVLPQLEHSYSAVVTAPTATAQGYTTYTCSGCGDSYVSDYVPALGQSYTVSFSVPTGVSAVSSMTGNRTGITLPAAGAPVGYTFVGWTTQSMEETTSAPVILTGQYVPAENTTLYALYTRQEISGQGNGNYEKVTATPTDWEGEYVIVYEAGECAFNGSLTKLDAVNNYVSVTINDNTIAATEADPCKFTIEATTDGYCIRSSSGYYIGTTGNANGLITSTSTVYGNTLRVNGDGTVNVISSAGAYLRFNSMSNQMRFRYYQSSTYTGQKAICLYKKSSGSPVTYYSTLSPKAAQVADTQYESFADAYAAADGRPIKLLTNLGSASEYYALRLTEDVTIDLNGFYAYLAAEGDYALYGMDSLTTDYETEDYGVLYTAGAAASGAEGYLALSESSNGYSFHAYEVKLTHVSLQADADALGYKAQVFGDYRVLDSVTGYGFTMQAGGEAKTYSKTQTPADGIFSLRLKGIMAAGGGEQGVTATAFVVLNGKTVSTEVEQTTMKETILAVNAMTSLSAAQKASVYALYAAYKAVMDPWLAEENNNNIATWA